MKKPKKWSLAMFRTNPAEPMTPEAIYKLCDEILANYKRRKRAAKEVRK